MTFLRRVVLLLALVSAAAAGPHGDWSVEVDAVPAREDAHPTERGKMSRYQ